MTEGLEVSILNLNELEAGIRIDAELYRKDFVFFENRINQIPHTALGNEVQLIKKGIFDIKSSVYSDKGVPFVRISNLKKGLIQMEDIIYIPESENLKNSDTQLVRNDIILSKTANAAASLVNIPICNTSQDTVAVKLKSDSKLLSHFVVIYLNSKYGLQQMQRWFTGNIQMHLNLDDCKKNLLLPIYSKKFQTKIRDIFEKSITQKGESEKLYNQAEALLLEAIGLADFELSREPVNVKSFKESFLATGRLDAEYYQVKFDQLEKYIRTTKNFKKIRDIRTDNFRGVQPIYVEDGNLDVINSKHILEKTLDYGNFEKTSLDQWDAQERARVYKGDILTYTTGANIGRTQVYLIDDKALASNHVNILRLREGNPYYVGFVLNSLVGRMQTDKYSAGSAQAELYPKDIDEYLIPFISDKDQKKIISLVEQSFALKNESERLLDLTKKALEIAIEQNEAAGMKLLG